MKLCNLVGAALTFVAVSAFAIVYVVRSVFFVSALEAETVEQQALTTPTVQVVLGQTIPVSQADSCGNPYGDVDCSPPSTSCSDGSIMDISCYIEAQNEYMLACETAANAAHYAYWFACAELELGHISVNEFNTHAGQVAVIYAIAINTARGNFFRKVETECCHQQ